MDIPSPSIRRRPPGQVNSGARGYASATWVRCPGARPPAGPPRAPAPDKPPSAARRARVRAEVIARHIPREALFGCLARVVPTVVWVVQAPSDERPPRLAASMGATSIFLIVIIASNARLA